MLLIKAAKTSIYTYSIGTEVPIRDGKVERNAHFNHVLYCQTAHQQVGWEISQSTEDMFEPLVTMHFMDIAKTQGIVGLETFVQMKRVYGMHPNKDIVVSELYQTRA